MQGLELARTGALAFLETFKTPAEPGDRELLLCVARTSLRTKLYADLADQLTAIVVDAVLTIRRPDEPIDLYMVRPSRAHTQVAPAAPDLLCSDLSHSAGMTQLQLRKRRNRTRQLLMRCQLTNS